MDQHVYRADFLQSYVTEMYKKAGMRDDDAQICSKMTIKTTLWGADSHGILRTPIYINRIMENSVDGYAEISEESCQKGAIRVFNGNNAMGYVAGYVSAKAAIEHAGKSGIAMVLTNNSNHYGAAGLYADMAADEGLIAICATNVKPNIGMPGSKKPSVGNNPVALAVPLPQEHNFILDISMSLVSGGKMLFASKEGKKIPTNWALTKDGETTDDPMKGFEGILLPMAMHKGYGMALFIDVITGLLSGGPFLHDLSSMYKNPGNPCETSHVMIAIDPNFLMPREIFDEKIKKWMGFVKSTPMTEDKKAIIPGELEYETQQKRLMDGITLPQAIVADLKKLEKELHMAQKLNEG